MNAKALELKDPCLQLALYNERAQYLKTSNPRHAWRTWQIARQARIATPAWVVAFLDDMAARELAVRSVAVRKVAVQKPKPKPKNGNRRTPRYRTREVS